MRIIVIDGQGGKMGRQLAERIGAAYPQAELTCVGTNAIATTAMLKAGARHAATGENAVIVACRRADVIIGPIGMVIADSLYGEITPAMARAVGQANAVRILLPMSKCENLVAGVPAGLTMQEIINDAMEKLQQAAEESGL